MVASLGIEANIWFYAFEELFPLFSALMPAPQLLLLTMLYRVPESACTLVNIKSSQQDSTRIAHWLHFIQAVSVNEWLVEMTLEA